MTDTTRTLAEATAALDEEFGVPDVGIVHREDFEPVSVQELAKRDAERNGSGRIILCTFDLETRAGKVRAFNSIGGSALSLSDHVGEVIGLRNVIAHTIELTNEATGEMVNHVRTVIEGSDGAFYAAVSEGIVNSLRKLFGIFGMPPYDPPLFVRARSVTTRKSFKVLVLELVEEEEEAHAKKK
jgi:hypothetical protein